MVKNTSDFRPESYSPLNYNINILNTINPKNYWRERKKFCLKNVYTNKLALINDSKNPKNVSLVTFKPSRIVDFIIEEDSKEWKGEWLELRKQTDLFAEIEADPEKLIEKVPFKFSYLFEDDEGISSKLMIEDWEIFELYKNCYRRIGDENAAAKLVNQKYFDEFTSKKDIYLFLGTTKQ